MPTILESRLSIFKKFDWNEQFKKNWFVVIVSLLIGAFSHIFWDSFTHDQGYFVKIIPTLTKPVDILGRQIPILKILQHSSSLIGGLLIVFAILKLKVDQNAKGQMSLKYWSVLIGLTLTILTFRVLIGLDLKAYGHIIVSGISAGLISLILTSMLTRQKNNWC